jgi:ribosomal protein L9
VQLPDGPIKEVGDHKINLLFHPEVSTEITVIVKPE